MTPFGSPFNFGAARFLQQGMPQQPQPGMPQGMQFQPGMTAATMLGLPQLMNQTVAPTPQQYGPFGPAQPQAPQQQQPQTRGLLDQFRRDPTVGGGGRQGGGMGGNRSRTGGPRGGPDRSHGGRF